MGAEHSTLGQLCSDTGGDAQRESRINTEIASRHRNYYSHRIKPKSPTPTSNYQRLEDHTNINISTMYNGEAYHYDQARQYEAEIATLREALNSSQNELSRIITQYNLNTHQIKKQYNELKDKYNYEMQQKSNMFQDLQDWQRKYIELEKEQNNLKSMKLIATRPGHNSDNSSMDSNASQRQIHGLTKSTMQLQQQIAELHMDKMHREEEIGQLEATNNIIQASNVALKEENAKLRMKLDDIQKLKSVLKGEYDELKQKYDASVEAEEKNVNDTQRQIGIFYNESSRAKSLFLCTSHIMIDGKDWSFLKWLKKNLNDKMSKTILNNDRCDELGLVSVLTGITMIYRTKLYQMRGSRKDKIPNIDMERVERYIQHLSVWIIRNKGVQLQTKQKVYVKMQDGTVMNEEVSKYKLILSLDELTKNLAHWIKEYVEDQGMLENVI